MTREEAIKFAEHAVNMTDIPEVKEFYRMAADALTPPNEPLTLEQLREMDGEPVYVVSAIGEHPEWYIVDLEENELKNPWDSISLENWDERYPYTAYRRPPEGEANA